MFLFHAPLILPRVHSYRTTFKHYYVKESGGFFRGILSCLTATNLMVTLSVLTVEQLASFILFSKLSDFARIVSEAVRKTLLLYECTLLFLFIPNVPLPSAVAA